MALDVYSLIWNVSVLAANFLHIHLSLSILLSIVSFCSLDEFRRCTTSAIRSHYITTPEDIQYIRPKIPRGLNSIDSEEVK